MKGGRGVFKEILVGGIKFKFLIFKFLKNNRKKKPSHPIGPVRSVSVRPVGSGWDGTGGGGET